MNSALSNMRMAPQQTPPQMPMAGYCSPRQTLVTSRQGLRTPAPPGQGQGPVSGCSNPGQPMGAQGFMPMPRQPLTNEARGKSSPAKQATTERPRITSGARLSIQLPVDQATNTGPSLNNSYSVQVLSGLEAAKAGPRRGQGGTKAQGNLPQAKAGLRQSARAGPRRSVQVQQGMTVAPNVPQTQHRVSVVGISMGHQSSVNQAVGKEPILILSDYHHEFAQAKLPRRFFRLMSKNMGEEGIQEARKSRDYRRSISSTCSTCLSTGTWSNIWDDDEDQDLVRQLSNDSVTGSRS